MEIKEILRDLRVQKGYSQEELAEKLFVTRCPGGKTARPPPTRKR